MCPLGALKILNFPKSKENKIEKTGIHQFMYK